MREYFGVQAAEALIGLIHGALPAAQEVTLSGVEWMDKTLTVSVPGVVADEAKQLVLVTPAAKDQEAYKTAQIRCSAQGNGTLTFTADGTPDVFSNLTVYVVIQEVGG